ncbi:MAG TPA: hypothetical protein VFW65_20890 [Pseudonocardiaceae bacterium]|nr:hypothetical protein [Pseudonocardiaceae bacterium]
MVELPACALTTPTESQCRTQTPLPSTNDAATATISSDLALPSTAVIAATAGNDSSGGDFTATSLKPSGAWQAGGSADSFTYSYPITVPPVPGGLQPDVTLSYDSQSVDGLTSSTNNQASWIGDGWSYSPGFIERSYQPCNNNPAGATKTNDNCWSDSDVLTLSLGGRTTRLVKDDATGTYRPQNDDHERVQLLTGAGNDAQNGEYFEVTTTDGTQYFFGMNQLPGWMPGVGDDTTNSVWTEPVFATQTGQPCFNATFADSWCQQAYRWNLDYVVDTHSDVVSYFYNTETNFYARDNGRDDGSTADTSYVRGGYLTKILYGQRAGQVYTTSPAAQVLFTTTGRCDLASCDPATLSKDTASHWPDVPFDLTCAQNAACTNQSPAFWSESMLQSIQTQALVGTTETNVDQWSLAHTFPDPGDTTPTNTGTTPSLWLSSITHMGQDTTAGGSSSPITLPAITFTSVPLANRVNLGEGYPPLTRQRMHQITTETGEIITVSYSSPACGAATPADPSNNTSLCYPSFWTPLGLTAPIEDWFNKYIVTGVAEHGATLAEVTVSRYVTARRIELGLDRIEVAVPQAHLPGAEAEVDFGEFRATIAGMLTTLWLFVMRLSHSGKAFHVAFATQAQEAFLEGHVAAFTYFGGIPARIRYENVPRNIFRHQPGRSAAEERERLHMAGRPRGLVHRNDRPDEHVPGVRQHHDERPDPLRPTGARVGPRSQHPVVDLRLQPRIRIVPQYRDLAAHRVLGQVRRDIPLERGHRTGHPVLVAQPLMDRRLAHPGPQHLGDVLPMLVEVRPGHLPQPRVGQVREPLLDQRRPVRLGHRRPTGHEPRRDRRLHIATDRSARHAQRPGDIVLRPPGIPMHQDLGYIDHVERPPRHPLPSHQGRRAKIMDEKTEGS